MSESDELYVKKCTCCGRVFRTDRNSARQCDGCLKQKSYKQASKKKASKPNFMSISQTVSAMEEYNRKHKTYYTYGQFVEGIKNGKIEV